ncbi:recombinase family protein, partial [Streptomyces sp. NPDC058664]|uniref:recombinase family protein n=1 Tax=Streptomyces sp. NPDC058664 TaxID=3346585 RepID=UPI00364AD6FC
MSKTLTAATRTLRAVAYVRVSTEEQLKGYGIAAGEEVALDYIEDEGWEHVDTFKDEGVPGALPWQERDVLPRLMSMARQSPRPFDVVVVPETRAIGREERVFWRWVWEMEDLGVFVAVADKGIDNTTEDGKASMREEANYAFKEYTRIRTRTQRGIQKKAQAGGWPGGVPPYGWYIESQGRKGESRAAVLEAEADTARRMRELRVRRKSYSQIAAVLNAEHRVRRDGGTWDERNVRWILTSAALLTNTVVTRKQRTAKLDEDGNPLHGTSVVIQLPELFSPEEIEELESAQKFLAGSQSVQRESAVYPVSGRLKSLCGGSYTGYRRKSRNDYRMYRCNGRGCDCSQIDADLIEKAVWRRVCALLGDPQQLNAMAKDWSQLAARNRVNFGDRIKELKEQIAEQDDLIDVTASMKVSRALRQGLSKAEAKAAAERAVKPLEAELERLRKELSQVAEWQAEADASEQQLMDLQRLASVARLHLAELSPTHQAEVLALLGAELEVTGPTPKAPPTGSPGAWFLENRVRIPALTDMEWAAVEPVLMALDSGRGPKQLPKRDVLEAILLKARTGMRWEDLPERYGKPASIRQRWNRWSKSGAWAQIMAPLKDAPGDVPPLLPPIEMRGRLDPRALIGHMAAPGDSVPVEP